MVTSLLTFNGSAHLLATSLNVAICNLPESNDLLKQRPMIPNDQLE